MALRSLPHLDRSNPTMLSVDRTSGNEMLTSAAAAVLTVLLAAEGFTLLSLNNMLTAHMFIGLLLVPPVLLKLASTGYRFARYYTGTPEYVEKGPPQVFLRLLAPVLVAMTVVVLASGVGLLALGHRSGLLLQVHKASFVIWGATFAVHFLAHLPRMMRSLGEDWSGRRRRPVPGAVKRAGLVLASLGGGVALAVALLSAINHWQGGGGDF